MVGRFLNTTPQLPTAHWTEGFQGWRLPCPSCHPMSPWPDKSCLSIWQRRRSFHRFHRSLVPGLFPDPNRWAVAGPTSISQKSRNPAREHATAVAQSRNKLAGAWKWHVAQKPPDTVNCTSSFVGLVPGTHCLLTHCLEIKTKDLLALVRQDQWRPAVSRMSILYCNLILRARLIKNHHSHTVIHVHDNDLAPGLTKQLPI
jgi:hypothetical protein